MGSLMECLIFGWEGSFVRKFASKMLSEKTQIRCILLFHFRLGSTTLLTLTNIQKVFGEESIVLRTVQKWFKRFKNGDFSLEDEPKSGRVPEVDLDSLKARIEEEPTSTTRSLALEFGFSNSTIHHSLKKIGMTSKLCRWVPHVLSQSNKTSRLSCCISLLNKFEENDFLRRIVTCDEKWISYENVVRTRSWQSKGTAATAVAKRPLHGKKVLLSVFWDCEGIIHHEYLPNNQTITSEFYQQQLDRVKAKLAEKRPALLNRRGVLFHQDNARPHVSASTILKLNSLGWELMVHPPYSPDLAPSDFHLFRSLSNFLTHKKFDNCEQLQLGVSEFFDSKDASFFRSGIFKLPDRWRKVLASEGDYFPE